MSWTPGLEPHRGVRKDIYPKDFQSLYSLAVSLKRIADMLEDVIGKAKEDEFLTEPE